MHTNISGSREGDDMSSPGSFPQGHKEFLDDVFGDAGKFENAKDIAANISNDTIIITKRDQRTNNYIPLISQKKIIETIVDPLTGKHHRVISQSFAAQFLTLVQDTKLNLIVKKAFLRTFFDLMQAYDYKFPYNQDNDRFDLCSKLYPYMSVDDVTCFVSPDPFVLLCRQHIIQKSKENLVHFVNHTQEDNKLAQQLSQRYDYLIDKAQNQGVGLKKIVNQATDTIHKGTQKASDRAIHTYYPRAIEVMDGQHFTGALITQLNQRGKQSQSHFNHIIKTMIGWIGSYIANKGEKNYESILAYIKQQCEQSKDMLGQAIKNNKILISAFVMIAMAIYQNPSDTSKSTNLSTSIEAVIGPIADDTANTLTKPAPSLPKGNTKDKDLGSTKTNPTGGHIKKPTPKIAETIKTATNVGGYTSIDINSIQPPTKRTNTQTRTTLCGRTTKVFCTEYGVATPNLAYHLPYYKPGRSENCAIGNLLAIDEQYPTNPTINGLLGMQKKYPGFVGVQSIRDGKRKTHKDNKPYLSELEQYKTYDANSIIELFQKYPNANIYNMVTSSTDGNIEYGHVVSVIKVVDTNNPKFTHGYLVYDAYHKGCQGIKLAQYIQKMHKKNRVFLGFTAHQATRENKIINFTQSEDEWNANKNTYNRKVNTTTHTKKNDQYSIDRYVSTNAQNANASTCPITKEMIYNTSKKFDIPPSWIAAIIQNDSNMGTKGLGAKNHNPGNVAQYDHLTQPTTGYPNRQTGVDAVGQELADRVTKCKKNTGSKPNFKEVVLGKKNKNKFDGAYMTNKEGQKLVCKIQKQIAQAEGEVQS